MDRHETILLQRLRMQEDQTPFAEKLGISQSLLSKIEWGQRMVSDAVWEKFNEEFEFDDRPLTENELFFLRFRARGLTVSYGSKLLGIPENQLSAVLRGYLPVTERMWEALEKDANYPRRSSW